MSLGSPLILRISDLDIDFARYDRDTKKFELVHHTTSDDASFVQLMQRAIVDEPMLQTPTERVEVICNTPVVLTPLIDFKEETCESVYHFCIRHNEPQRVFYDTLPDVEAVLSFALPESHCAAIDQMMGNVRYTSAYVPMLHHLLHKGLDRVKRKRTFCILRKGKVDVVMFNHTQLLLINTFEVQSEKDTAYYVLNAFTKLGGNKDFDEFYVIGNQEEREKTTLFLKSFAQHVYAIDPQGEFNRHPMSLAEDAPYDVVCYFSEK